MITPESSTVISSTNRSVELVNHRELSSTDDGISSLTLEGLGISSHESLIAEINHIRNHLKTQFVELHFLRDTRTIVDSSGHISEGLLHCNALKHLLRHTVENQA